MNFHKMFDHVPMHFIWSIFPILMFIAFFMLPGGTKPQTKTQKATTFVLALIILGIIGWVIYDNFRI